MIPHCKVMVLERNDYEVFLFVIEYQPHDGDLQSVGECKNGFDSHCKCSGRRSFLDPPTVYLRRGKWILGCLGSFCMTGHISGMNFQSREEIFDSARDSTSVGDVHRKYIR
ncbi:unnamed protein product [Calypogeia fissa]